jgi:hypothetical protein
LAFHPVQRRVNKTLSPQKKYDENSRRLGRKHSPEVIKKDNAEFFEELRQQFNEFGLRQLDREVAEEEAKEKASEQADGLSPHKNGNNQSEDPISTDYRPGESVTITVLRNFLEELRARRKREQSTQPPSATGPAESSA